MTETQLLGIGEALVIVWSSLIPAFWLLASQFRRRNGHRILDAAFEEDRLWWEEQVDGALDD